MEYFFNNNLYIIFAIFLLTYLCNNNIKDNKKIIIIYLFIILLTIFNILDLQKMILLFLICAFLYFEFLISDNYKLKIIRKIRYKIYDFIYLLLFKYLFGFYIICLFFLSDYFLEITKIPPLIMYVVVAFIMFQILLFISSNEFELSTFDETMNKLNNKINFGHYDELDKSKQKILLFIEDKSFFERPHSYTIICYDYIKYRINRINEVIAKIENAKGRKHKLTHIIKFIKYSFSQFIKQLEDLPTFLNRVINGHSTIEMQLFRSIAVKSGFTKKYQRKIAELVYTPMFFGGLKAYYKNNYDRVSDLYFKNFILAAYLKFAPVFYNKKIYANINEFFGKRKKISDMEFLLYTLCLSGKLDRENSSQIINYYISVFNLNKKSIKKVLFHFPNNK